MVAKEIQLNPTQFPTPLPKRKFTHYSTLKFVFEVGRYGKGLVL